MAERGIDFEQLGALLGYAPDTVRQALSTNRPKTRRVMERIQAWFEDPHTVTVAATAAAAEAPAKTSPPFRARPGGAGARARAENGATAST
jgi:hypothetical protein